MTQERRAHPRYKLSLSAEINDGTRTFTAQTRDLSAGGCCVEAAYPLTEEAEIVVKLFLVIDNVEDSSNPPLEVHAAVQWTAENDDGELSNRYLAGIKFAQITDAQTAWLKQVLARIDMGSPA